MAYHSMSTYHHYDGREHYEEVNVTIPDWTDDAFGLDANVPTLVLFYAPWCFHCIQFKPVFQQFANYAATNFPNLKLANVDCTQSPRLADAYHIEGYPTLLLLYKGNVTPYNKPRDLDTLKQWTGSFFSQW